ncbi:MAG: glycosyltransferase family 4 protein [Candidatus Omnitrophica bacterium]|nr:glycosyltransferase family 4 protein [Candidatus Omnitrophota bacterium]
MTAPQMRFLMLNWRDPCNPLAGGAERVTLGYLTYLAAKGHEVFWFAPLFPGAASEEIIEGVRVVRAGGIGSSILEAQRWFRRQPRFDLVIDQHHGIPWFAPWWCRTNCVAYIHEVLGPIWDAFYRWPYNALGRWQERRTHWLYRKVPFWTASTSTKASLEASGVRSVTLIPYGVHTVALPDLEAKPLRQPLSLVVVSRLAPNKRVDHAMRTLKLLVDKGINANLTIVGQGIIEQQLHQLASELSLEGRVKFTGALSEPGKDAALRRAHLLLHTSMREGWGLNVIEANAMGTPAVVYPVAGLIESTLHEETGLVSVRESPDSLAECVLTLVNRPNQYQVLRRNAWNRAKTFHWDQVLPKACAWLEAQARRGRD